MPFATSKRNIEIGAWINLILRLLFPSLACLECLLLDLLRFLLRKMTQKFERVDAICFRTMQSPVIDRARNTWITNDNFKTRSYFPDTGWFKINGKALPDFWTAVKIYSCGWALRLFFALLMFSTLVFIYCTSKFDLHGKLATSPQNLFWPTSLPDLTKFDLHCPANVGEASTSGRVVRHVPSFEDSSEVSNQDDGEQRKDKKKNKKKKRKTKVILIFDRKILNNII